MASSVLPSAGALSPLCSFILWWCIDRPSIEYELSPLLSIRKIAARKKKLLIRKKYCDHCILICSKHLLITTVGELPMLWRNSPDQSIPAFSSHFKWFPSPYRCLWCRPLRGNSLLETTGSSANDLHPGWGYCFHVLHNSCIFLFRYHLYMVFFSHNGSSVSFEGHWWGDVCCCDWGDPQENKHLNPCVL